MKESKDPIGIQTNSSEDPDWFDVNDLNNSATDAPSYVSHITI
jgi:hypothetical protein